MYYDLVYDSLEIQSEIFDYLVKKYDEKILTKDKKFIQLYLNEKNAPNTDSLEDNEIGSLIKEKSN